MSSKGCLAVAVLSAFMLSACSASPVVSPNTLAPADPTTPDIGQECEIAELDFLEHYAATYGFWLGMPSSIRPTPDGSEVLFLRATARDFTQTLYSFDLESGEERVLLTADQVLMGETAELSEEERERRERLRSVASGIASYQLSRDGSHILVPLSGRLFHVKHDDGTVVELQTEAGYPNDARLSPTGEDVAYVVDSDLYVFNIAGSHERRLTETAAEHLTNGLPGFIAQEEMLRYAGYWWSPAGTQLAYEETDTTDVERLYAHDPADPTAQPHESYFPRAGTQNPASRLGVISADGGETRWIEWDQEAFPYLATVRWSPNAPLTVVVQNRAQDEVRILAADPETGETRVLHTETDAHWVNLDQQVPRWLDDGSAFLWTTERRGAWQLELRDADGELVGELTPLDFVYDGLLHVDEARRLVWIRGGVDPIETQVFRLPLDSNNDSPNSEALEAMVSGAGVHSAVIGDDGETWVERRRPFQGDSEWIVHSGEQRVGALTSAGEQPPFLPDLVLATVGERQFRTAIIRPRNFQEGRRYPVLVSVYGGPSIRVVRASARHYLSEQWIADQGYIVVSIDGRGTTGRGAEWERAIAGNFIDAALEDQVTALQALGERFDAMDLSRVGIYGWSFGGYMATMAVLLRPDVFHVAVAGAPVTEWREYDTHYTEHYMGLPQDNVEGYDRSSALTHAARLERPLLLIHGTSDDNVYFTHTARLSDALLRAGRPHTVLPLSGATHLIGDPELTRGLAINRVRFFNRHLRPACR